MAICLATCESWARRDDVVFDVANVMGLKASSAQLAIEISMMRFLVFFL
jgi:hypothetical protein